MATDTAPAVDLTGYNDVDLLQAGYALTHRIHGAEDAAAEYPRNAERHEARAADLRAQRDLITAEVLRRMGGR